MPDKDKVFIFDTTMRDGEQSPGASMSVEEKIQISRVFDEMGIDIIEAGFPISSPGDCSPSLIVVSNINTLSLSAILKILVGEIYNLTFRLQNKIAILAQFGTIFYFLSLSTNFFLPIHGIIALSFVPTVSIECFDNSSLVLRKFF